MADSSTLSNAFDYVVVYLAMDGCTFTPVDTISSIGLANKSYSFLFYAPGPTDKAKLLAAGYRGPNRVEAYSDSLIEFDIGVPTGASSEPVERRFMLYPSTPNPFNPATTIRFETAAAGLVAVKVYSTDGRLVRTLIHQYLPAGPYSVVWNGTDEQADPVGSGVYFCEVVSQGSRLTRKLNLIK